MFSPINSTAVFINLNESKDRCVHVTNELKQIEPLFGVATRMEAIRHTPGWIGCARSHVLTLQNALATCAAKIEFLAIFEDDFIWRRQHIDPCCILNQINDVDFDVLILAYPAWIPHERDQALVLSSNSSKNSNVIRVFAHAFWTTGYVVRRRYWQILADHWAKETCPIDLAWQELQARDKFYAIVPSIGNQVWTQQSCIQTYEYRNFNGKVDMNIFVIFNDVAKDDMLLAKRLFHHIELIRHPDIIGYARRNKLKHKDDVDLIVCVQGNSKYVSLWDAIHTCWKYKLPMVLVVNNVRQYFKQ